MFTFVNMKYIHDCRSFSKVYTKQTDLSDHKAALITVRLPDNSHVERSLGLTLNSISLVFLGNWSAGCIPSHLFQYFCSVKKGCLISDLNLNFIY